MKLITSALIVGAASAAVAPQQHQQQVIKDTPKNVLKDAIDNAFIDHAHSQADSLFGSVKDEAASLWDEVAREFPEAMSKVTFTSPPKAHRRRADHEWDFITRGTELQGVRVEASTGEERPALDGKLDTYHLRTKKVDPGVLGVDPGVKQYSGYLDDDENDKHLFYCSSSSSRPDAEPC